MAMLFDVLLDVLLDLFFVFSLIGKSDVAKRVY